MSSRTVAIVGAGWAGLAAAVRLVEAGRHVTVFETAAAPGGRARTVTSDGLALDNGQHILVGAYRRTLALMQAVGADPDALLARLPLELRFADGRGLALPPGGSPAIAFARGVAGCKGWSWGERFALIGAASRWVMNDFRCAPGLTVEALTRTLPPAVREILIDPLTVAALNTPAAEASAQVLLRVLRDALFGGRGSADLLLPRAPLSALLPDPAVAWLRAHGADVRLGRRVETLAPQASASGWRIGSEDFDAIVLACPAPEAARLARPHAPAWAARAAALRHEPIVTVYLRMVGGRLPAPMTALAANDAAPAQFAFDHGALGVEPDRFAFVASGAADWTARGLEATGRAVLAQARPLLPDARLLRVLADKRATFRCTPGLDRPPADIAPGLVAAGDYVDGPYPATLEAAVGSGEAAAAALA